ncbi:XRE family transcriptional regulator [Ralstonia thomasii]|nr:MULTISPECIES: S24 family peptidase [Ralstonia]MBT2177759.1 helix-turn-helix domain-containing protein [Ralstonia pickettii]
MDTFANRVLARRTQLEMSQEALAKKARLSQSTIAQIERGRNRGSKYVVALADALLVPVRWLADGGDMPPRPSEVEGLFVSQTEAEDLVDRGVEELLQARSDDAYWKGTVAIPQFDAGGSMGGGIDLPDQPGLIQNLRVTKEWLDFNVRSCTSPKNLCVVTGFGDSMRPLFNPGDPLLLDRGVITVEIDAVYFFRIGKEGFIKRLQRVPGNGLIAISENKAYREWTITPDMDFEVFGRVLKAWRSEDL